MDAGNPERQDRLANSSYNIVRANLSHFKGAVSFSLKQCFLSLGWSLPSRGHLAMPGNRFDYYNWTGASSILDQGSGCH